MNTWPLDGDLFGDVHRIVAEFNAGHIGPASVPTALRRRSDSGRLDSIEDAVFLSADGGDMTPEQFETFNRQWATFRMARHVRGDRAAIVLATLREVLAGVEMDTADGLRLQVLLELLDPEHGARTVLH